MFIDLPTLIAQLPYRVFWKDTHSIFRGGNSHFAQVAGLQSTDEIDGKSDFDFPWGKTHAEDYRQIDREVISRKVVFKGFETQVQAHGQLVRVSVNKTPLYDKEGKVIGLICQYTEVDDCASLPEISFTHKQRNMLTMIAKGYSAKKIAAALSLSTRTIESYLAILKKKLTCRNKSELVIKAREYERMQLVI